MSKTADQIKPQAGQPLSNPILSTGRYAVLLLGFVVLSVGCGTDTGDGREDAGNSRVDSSVSLDQRVDIEEASTDIAAAVGPMDSESRRDGRATGRPNDGSLEARDYVAGATDREESRASETAPALAEDEAANGDQQNRGASTLDLTAPAIALPPSPKVAGQDIESSTLFDPEKLFNKEKEQSNVSVRVTPTLEPGSTLTDDPKIEGGSIDVRVKTK